MSRAKRVGLPDFVKSKFDNHFVEELSARTRTPVIRNISIDKLVVNVNQPRKEFGELEELADSIREKGILEPVLVRPRNGKFEIIAGERRFRAAKLADLQEIPCLEHDVADNEALELSIIENIQRKDLTIYEQAFSIKSFAEIYGYTHQDIAQKIGKSRVTVSELIRLTDLPEEILERCTQLKINSKTFLLQLVKLEAPELMTEVLDNYSEKPFSRELIKEKRKGENPAEDSGESSDEASEASDEPVDGLVDGLPDELSNESSNELADEEDPDEGDDEDGSENAETGANTGYKSFKINISSDDDAVKIKFDIKSRDRDKGKIIGMLEKLIEDLKADKFKDFSF